MNWLRASRRQRRLTVSTGANARWGVIAFVLIMLVGGPCRPALTAPAPPMPAATDPGTPTPSGPAQQAPPQPKPITEFPILPFDEAVLAAANELFSDAVGGAASVGQVRRALTIDPLIDGVTAAQSVATRSIRAKIVELAQSRYRQFEVRPFTTATIAQSPLVLIGTLTGIDQNGEPAGPRDSYRIWLTLMDLRSGKIVAKARARAKRDTVDATPTPQFRDSPAWAEDEAAQAYIETCHNGKVGAPIPRDYLDRILAAALVSDAVEAYDAGRYREALDLYTAARDIPGGEQLRVYNGIYLVHWQLGQKQAAAQAFGDIVDYGLRSQRLAVKFLFKPASIAFWPDPEVSGPYDIWLRQIATRTARRNVCLEITGHTSRTGPEPLNERLSLLRAEYIKRRLEEEEPTLGGRMIANGVGSRENLVGTATEDSVDALDRRVEFKTPPC